MAGADEGEVAEGGFAAAAYEVVLEGEIALVGMHECAYGFVAHWEDAGGDVELAAQAVGDFGQVDACFEPLVAEEMEGEVLVAESEPIFAAEALGLGEHVPGFVGAAPAGLGVVDGGQAVEDGVDVGADGEAPVLEVVAGVDDDGQVAGGQRCLQAGREFGPADTAGEGHDRGSVRQFGGHRTRFS